jgi:hypothetical protein
MTWLVSDLISKYAFGAVARPALKGWWWWFGDTRSEQTTFSGLYLGAEQSVFK